MHVEEAGMPDRIQNLMDSFYELSPREKVLLAGLAGVFCFLLVGSLWYFINSGLSAREERCENLSRAVTLLERHEDELRLARMADARTDARIQEPVPMLQGHLDKIAGELEVEVKEYKSLPERTLGKEKNYLEKSIRLRILGIQIDRLANFLDQIESGRHLILVSSLDMQTRTGHPELLDVDMVVSTYERVEDKARKKKEKEAKKRKSEERKKAGGA